MRWAANTITSDAGDVPQSRRLVVRYERSAHNYLGVVHLGCIVILLRQQR
jgi:hypothetical protein